MKKYEVPTWIRRDRLAEVTADGKKISPFFFKDGF